jgi:mono/diheme cytochrome c family protein
MSPSNFLRLGLALAALAAALPATAQTSSSAARTGVTGGDAPGGGGVAPALGSGEQVYRYVCQSCHMADAKGGTGAATIPALASNPRLVAPAYPVTMILNGRGAMPWFRDTLTPAQIADVATYVRTHFGNNYPKPVTEAEVRALAGKP